MAVRALVYALVGLGLECIFTGAYAFATGDRNATGRTYLWMLGCYALGGLLLEPVQALPRWSAVVVGLAVIYAVEYAYGWALRRLIGACPWEYREGVHVHGLVRLDYAPFWLGISWAFAPATRLLFGSG